MKYFEICSAFSQASCHMHQSWRRTVWAFA